MDRPLDSKTKRKQSFGQYLRIGLIVGVLALAVWAVQHFLRPSAKANSFSIGTVEKGSIENRITASGLVVPAFATQINAPIATQVMEVLLASGTEVKEGDPIMKLNNEFIELQTESLKDRLELRKNNIQKLNLEFDKTLKDLGYDSEMKTLQIAGLEAQLADVKRLQKIGGATEEEVENAQLNLDIAKLESEKLINELAFQEKVVKTDRRNLELEQTIQEKELKELQRKLTQTTVRAPSRGVVTWINEDIGVQVNEGEALVRIANLDKFKIEAKASDRYTSQIQPGQNVRVRLGKQHYDGSISTILPAVENNQIGFLVQLDEAEKTELKANMRVEVFIVTDKKEDILTIKNGAAFSGGQRLKMFKVIGDEAIQIDVNVGLRNMDKVEISSPDIQPGDKIIVSDMKDYDHLSRINLKQS